MTIFNTGDKVKVSPTGAVVRARGIVGAVTRYVPSVGSYMGKASRGYYYVKDADGDTYSVWDFDVTAATTYSKGDRVWFDTGSTFGTVTDPTEKADGFGSETKRVQRVELDGGQRYWRYDLGTNVLKPAAEAPKADPQAVYVFKPGDKATVVKHMRYVTSKREFYNGHVGEIVTIRENTALDDKAGVRVRYVTGGGDGSIDPACLKLWNTPAPILKPIKVAKVKPLPTVIEADVKAARIALGKLEKLQRLADELGYRIVKSA